MIANPATGEGDDMARPIASVHLDIARFGWEVSKLKTDPERAEWLQKLAEALVMRDPTIHPYAAHLLEEAAKFVEAKSEKARQSANERWANKGNNAAASDRMPTHADASGRMRSHATDQTEHSEHTGKDQEGAAGAADGLPPESGKSAPRKRGGGKTAKVKSNPGESPVPAVLAGNTDFMSAWSGFLEMRASIKKPATRRAQDLLINKLRALSGGSSKTAIEVLNQSTRNNWQDIYELRANQSFGKSTKAAASEDDRPDLDFLPTGTD
jgi:hypothetical protein